jgi:hypothetical protein
MDITLYAYITLERDRVKQLGRFKKYWLTRHAADPACFPLELYADDWDDNFDGFIMFGPTESHNKAMESTDDD